jgi:hypothetical protein
MGRFTDINEWSEYWLNEFKKNRDYWVKNGPDGFQFELVFDSQEARDAAWSEICDFWDGGGWCEPYDNIDNYSSNTGLGVYLICPEIPLVIRIARNHEGRITCWDNRFLEEPPAHIPYWIPSNYRLELRKKNIERSKKSKSGCYIATAVYGSYNCPKVWMLRRFRDNTLDATSYGRAFIKTYYAISPTLVKWFGETSWFKKLWRKPLDKLVSSLKCRGVEDTPYIDKY